MEPIVSASFRVHTLNWFNSQNHNSPQHYKVQPKRSWYCGGALSIPSTAGPNNITFSSLLSSSPIGRIIDGVPGPPEKN